MTWTLVIMMHVGPMGSGNSNALTNVTGFKSLDGCKVAGKQAEALASSTVKEIRTVCVEIK